MQRLRHVTLDTMLGPFRQLPLQYPEASYQCLRHVMLHRHAWLESSGDCHCSWPHAICDHFLAMKHIAREYYPAQDIMLSSHG